VKISIIGTGYIGLVTGTCLADLTSSSSPSPLRGEGRVRVKYSSVITREQSDRSNPNLSRRTGVPRFHEGRPPVYSIPFDPLTMENSRNIFPTLTYCQDVQRKSNLSPFYYPIWYNIKVKDTKKIRKFVKIRLNLNNIRVNYNLKCYSINIFYKITKGGKPNYDQCNF